MVTTVPRCRRLPLAVGGGIALAVVAAMVHYALRPESIPNPYAPTHLTIAVSSGLVGTWVAWRRPGHPIGWMLLLAGALGAWMYAAQPLWTELALAGAPSWVLRTMSVLVVWPWLAARSVLLIGAPSVLPGGRPHGWRRWILVAGVVDTVVLCVAQVLVTWDERDDGSIPPPSWWRSAADRVIDVAAMAQWGLGLLAVGGLVLVGVVFADQVTRRQTRVFAAAAVVLAVPALSSFGRELWPALPWAGDQWELVASGALPLALGAAVVFDHFLDVRMVVRRTVLFGGLSALAIAAYAVVSAVVNAATDWGSTSRQGVAAAVLAVALVPAHSWLHRWVEHHVYGQTSRPDLLLAELGQRLRSSSGSRDALIAMADGIRSNLRLPFVAIEVEPRDGHSEEVAVAGERPAITEPFPIEFAGEVLGRLIVGTRTSAEPLRPVERALLGDLAGHAGAVAHDVLLDSQLRLSRQQLVEAREEERRRLRADLHDGLGPTLASVALGMDAAAQQIDDPELSELLDELTDELRVAIGDIRRLVYGLRPPALDEVGLTRAVEQHAAGLVARSTDLNVHVEAAPLRELPAAVEVAAYRIIMEALTNVARHADARICAVKIEERDGALWIEVDDDGRGVPVNVKPGVGILSMRQRAEELRGGAVVESIPSGTRLRAWLPLDRAVPA